MNDLIETLKESGQDFEFYPTTDEIIRAVIRDMKHGGGYDRRNHGSILDIGAGNGKVLSAVAEELSHIELYAIEKAPTLRDLLNNSVYVIGTDFLEQSLIDKNIDVTFCNPPYSEYEAWATKIIKESASHTVYLVIPTRWKDSQDIKAALSYRDAKYKTLGEYDFEDAERRARATANLIRIELSTEKEDAFDRLFNDQFKELLSKFPKASPEESYSDKTSREEKEKESKFGGLVLGSSYVSSLVAMYNEDLKNIRRNYDLVGKLDAGLLKEFDVSPEKVLKCLKEKTKGLKNLYWHELLSRMSEITDRLTAKRRDSLFQTLNQNANVDFTASNIYAVILWIIQKAGSCIEEQLLETYEEMLSKANCRNYVSNQRVFEWDKWRYNRTEGKPTHVFLDYRIVLNYYGAIERGYSGDYSISERAADYIRDLLTISYNLGFKGNTGDGRLWRYSREKIWAPGSPQEFYGIYKGKREIIVEVKCHLNGNLHIRMNQKLALALNVEYGRIKGWIHSKQDAEKELNDSDAGEYFKTNFTLLTSSIPFMIENKTEPTEETPTEESGEGLEQISMF